MTPLNTKFWMDQFALYEGQRGTIGEYYKGFEPSTYYEQIETLWNWKFGMFPQHPPDRYLDFIEKNDITDYIGMSRQESLEALMDDLDTNSPVTPVFLLHVADSSQYQYSQKYPIYDQHVWRAFDFLDANDRKPDERKLAERVGDDVQDYIKYCRFIDHNTTKVGTSELERSMFSFGKYLNSCEIETFGETRDLLKQLQNQLETPLVADDIV